MRRSYERTHTLCPRGRSELLEVLGGLGLILPALIGIMSILSPLAALGLLIIVVGAAVSHARHGEGKQTVATSVVTVLIAFATVGRFWLTPI